MLDYAVHYPGRAWIGDYTVTWDPEAPVRRLIARFPEEVISVRGPQRPAKARQADRG